MIPAKTVIPTVTVIPTKTVIPAQAGIPAQAAIPVNAVIPAQAVIPAKAGILYACGDLYRIKEPRMAIQPAVYLLASKRNGTIYIGVTSNLFQRIWQHRNESTRGFTQKYCVHKLVYYEIHEDMREAILREKRLKKWNRGWKVNLIEAGNPQWVDLWDQICR